MSEIVFESGSHIHLQSIAFVSIVLMVALYFSVIIVYSTRS